jgi:pimeloyl-ACP methyl ester carboxylesterase
MKNKNLLVLIPGLGADARLFYPQIHEFKHSLTPPWIPPEKDETLAHYAQRWAAQLKLPKNCVLAGVSFGGMVALEMSKWVNPKAVIIISSCRHPSSVPLVLRIMGGFPFWPTIGKLLVPFFRFKLNLFLNVKIIQQRSLLIEMFLETPNDFLLWTVQAIGGWAGYKGQPEKIHAIHGDRDRLIPLANVQADQIIRGGGHMIVVTHTQEVNNFIKKWV